jgi:membrane fusion protein, multidrug efflux system
MLTSSLATWRMANEDALLWPGQFVNAHLIVGNVENGITAPAIAVQTGPNGQYVFVIGHNDVVEMRAVTVVQTENGISLIGSGLLDGEKVVTSGYSQLTPGARVVVKEILAARAAGIAK